VRTVEGAALRQGGVERVLSRGGWANPDVSLVRTPDGPVVLKDFSPRSAWVRSTIGRLSIRRELRAYRALADHPSVPRLVALVDPLALAFEHRPGRMLQRSLASSLPSDFVLELERAVAGMHERGVVHLDLRHRSNVLADSAGRPVIVDFGSAICFRPRGFGARWLLPLLARLDHAALEKWRLRLAPQAGSGASEASGTASAGSRGARRPM